MCNKGSLTIEASIILSIFTFFILFFFSFGQVYKVQNIVSHATIQTAESISIDSYFREALGETNVGKATGFICDLLNVDNDFSSSVMKLSDSNIGSVVKKSFIASLSDSENEANDLLKKNGVKNGINGIDLSESKLSGDDVIISAKYTVKLQFPLFGKKELNLTKVAKSHLFKKK